MNARDMNARDPASPPLRVYMVEDDDDLRKSIVLLLGRAGFEVRGMPDAPAFYKAHALAPCEVAVLDVGLPGEDGLSLAAQLRASGPIGIVMASARAAVQERIEALRRGADVYMVKPVHVEELAATIRVLGSRVRAVTRPGAAAPPQHAAPQPAWRLAQGDWMLCAPSGAQLKLTTNERSFMACLMAARDGVVSRDDLLRCIDGANAGPGARTGLGTGMGTGMGMAMGPGVDPDAGADPDARGAEPKRLDVIASRLRRKATQAGMQLPLHAVRGSGYQFVRGAHVADAAPATEDAAGARN
jgi:two-component system response regulator PhoP